MINLRIAGFLCGLGEIGYSKMLLTPEFGPRVRVGIDRQPAGWDLANYVLGEFREEEKEAIARQIEEQMLSAARELDFERAAKLRDQLLEMRGEAPQKNEVQKKRRRTRESTRHH